MNIKEYQRQLKAEGYNPGPIDGDWGPLTQAATDLRQLKKGDPAPAWLIVAEREMGIHEVVGVKHNKRILEYHAATDLHASTDEVPWCSSFENFVMKAAGIKGTKSAAAASWLKWGKPTKYRYGCVCVFERTGGNHVANAVAIDDTHIAILGGNQSDSVRVSLHSRDGLIGMRWAS